MNNKTAIGTDINSDNDGVKLLIRCPECKRENYAPMAITGVCIWCGYSENDESIRKKEVKRIVRKQKKEIV